MFVRGCAAVVAVTALTSCASPAPVTPVPPPATTSSKPAPSLAEVDQRAKAALAPPGAFDARGGKVDDAAAALDLPFPLEGQAVGEVCGALPRITGKGTSAARSRSWGGTLSLFERVHVTSELPASAVVSTVRQHVRDCGRPAGTVVPDVALTKPDGLDEAYAFCEANEPGAIPWTCQVALARGNVFAFVTVNEQSKEAGAKLLAELVPVFARAVVEA